MTINLRDWSHTAAQRGWGPGWPSCAGVKAVGTVVVSADRSGVRLSVHPRIARLVDLLIDETERRGYLLKNGQCGAYNCRPIAGTDVSSNHAWALAVDLNWQENTYNNTGVHTIPAWVYALWARYGFANGSMYSGKQDWMHIEFMGTPADADAMTALALAELSGGAAPIPTPAPLPAAALEDDVSPVPIPVKIQPDGTFSLSARVESPATGSQLYAKMWIRYGPLWSDADGVIVGSQDGKGGSTVSKPVAIRGNVDVGYEVPSTAKCITIEGRLTGTNPKRTMDAWLLVKGQ